MNRIPIDLQSAIREMAACAGKTLKQISNELRRNDRYLSVMLREGTVPSVSLLSAIAKSCGYDVVLIGHGEALRLIPEFVEDTAKESPKGHDKIRVLVERSWHVSPVNGDGSLLLKSNKDKRDWFFRISDSTDDEPIILTDETVTYIDGSSRTEV